MQKIKLLLSKASSRARYKKSPTLWRVWAILDKSNYNIKV